MKYLLEIADENLSVLELKKKIETKEIRYNITTLTGLYIYQELPSRANKKYYIMQIPDNVREVNHFIQNNLDLVEFSNPMTESILFDLRSSFHLFEDIYHSDDFILSSYGEYDTFYIRKRNKELVHDINYRTVLNLLKDYYADTSGLFLNFNDWHILFKVIRNGKYIKVIMLPSNELDTNNKLTLNKRKKNL